MTKHTAEDKENWFQAQMFKHYIIMAGLFLFIIVGLFTWGVNITTKIAVQDEKNVTVQKDITEIKDTQKIIIIKIEKIDSKLPDNRISLLGE